MENEEKIYFITWSTVVTLTFWTRIYRNLSNINYKLRENVNVIEITVIVGPCWCYHSRQLNLTCDNLSIISWRRRMTYEFYFCIHPISVLMPYHFYKNKTSVRIQVKTSRVCISQGTFLSDMSKGDRGSFRVFAQPMRVGVTLYRPLSLAGRIHYVYSPSQWETVLQCIAISHWLVAHIMIPEEWAGRHAGGLIDKP